MGKSSKLMLSTVNLFAAQIMGDPERPKETDTSNSRRLCRFLLSVVAIIGLIAIMTFSLLNQPLKRSQRDWIKKEDLHNITGFLDRMAPQLNSIEWHCPCKAMDVVTAPKSRARLVEFFLINTNHSNNIIHVNSPEQFCSEVSSHQHFEGFNAVCNKLLRESFQLSGWDFNMGSSSLYLHSLKMGSLNPFGFMFDVCMSWAGGLSEATSFFLISNTGLKKEEAQELNRFLSAIRISLKTCSKNTSWPPPDNAVYIAEANKNPYDDNKIEYVVAMSFNWTHYFTMCAPSYCEYLQKNSAVRILFRALAQIGGFVSVLLFVLRSVVWPLICMPFGWHTSFETYQGKESEATGPK